MTITERIWLKINELGLKPAEISDKTGIDRASFTRWKNKDYKPSLDAIIVLSQFFNVSTDWLLTGEGSVKLDFETPESSTDEKLLLNAYRLANEENKMLILQKAIELSKQTNYKPETASIKLVAKEGGSIKEEITKEDAQEYKKMHEKAKEERLLRQLRE